METVKFCWEIFAGKIIPALGWGIFLLVVICAGEEFIKCIKRPRCPRFGCWSSKTITRFGTSGNPRDCAKCQKPYWHQGWRNFAEDPKYDSKKSDDKVKKRDVANLGQFLLEGFNKTNKRR